MKRYLLALLALPCFDASAAVIRCDNCSESAYLAQAQSRGAGPTGVDTHYVYDLPQGRVRKYEVSRSCEDGRVCYNETTPLPVEPEVELQVLELASYWHTTSGTMKGYVTITADGTIQHLSAYDVAGPGATRTQLINWISSAPQITSLQNTLPALIGAMHQIAVTIGSMWNDSMGKTLITIAFSDGSKIDLEYEVVNNTYTIIEGSAEDKFGNKIPMTWDQLNGAQFDYTAEGPNGPAGNRMRNHIYTMIGVPVTYGKWRCWAEPTRVVCKPY
jgi:hypothetical protein